MNGSGPTTNHAAAATTPAHRAAAAAAPLALCKHWQTTAETVTIKAHGIMHAHGTTQVFSEVLWCTLLLYEEWW